MDCPNLPQQSVNPFQCSVNKPAFGRGFGGAGGFGGRGTPCVVGGFAGGGPGELDALGKWHEARGLGGARGAGGVCFGAGGAVGLDSDHAGNPDTCRSVTGYVIMLNGAAVSWQSTRQQVTALSTAEAEYYAALIARTDVTYISRIMDDLGFPLQDPTTSVMYHKVRHIDTRVYHLRELCKDGALVLKKVASADQVAYSLTKSTLKPAFEKHRDAMMGLKGSRN
eukprot:2839605-Rhodomonas_salina.1